MDGIECSTIGVAYSFHPETGAVVLLFTMHDDENNVVAWMHMPVETATNYTMSVAARTFEAKQLEDEVQGTPMDDRPAKIKSIHEERLYSGTN